MAQGVNVLLELVEQLGRVGHWRVSLPDYVITWSAEIYRLHGMTPDRDAPSFETALRFYHPDDRGAIEAAIAGAAKYGAPFELTVRLVRADGELRYVMCRGMTIVGPNASPASVFGVLIDVTEQRRTEAALREANLKLEQSVYVDAITQLANRRQFDEILEREWRRAIREQTALSLVKLEIDKFELFEDQYGQVAGDDCLRAVAATLPSVARRPGDLVARWSGAEFALILPVTEAAGGEKVAQVARTAVQALKLPYPGTSPYGDLVTASVGVATAHPQHGAGSTAWRDLVAEADTFLLEAKRTGRNRVASATSLADAEKAPWSAAEETRLAILWAYEQLGATRRTEELDRIAKLAATLTSTPIGLVSLVGRDEQRFAGNFGLEGTDSTSRAVSFCAYTILGDEPFVVPDASRDSRFKANSLVTGDFGLRYYAGAPIISKSTGQKLGALCVIDTHPRAETSLAQRALLTELAKMASTLIQEAVISPGGALAVRQATPSTVA